MNQNILIIDDDIILGQQMVEAITAEGYNADYVSNGNDAFEIIPQKNYALCLLDYKLEDITGSEILKILKTYNPLCRILLLSGRPHIEDKLKEEGTFHLADGILPKPFKPAVFFEMIKKFLDNSPSL